MKVRTALALSTGVALFFGSVVAFHPRGTVQMLMTGVFCGMFSSMFWDRSNK